MMNLKPFETKYEGNLDKEQSIWKNIPIQYRGAVLATLRQYSQSNGYKYRLIYRGPRVTAPGDTRSRYSKRSNCLMQYADRFSVYVDSRKATW